MISAMIMELTARIRVVGRYFKISGSWLKTASKSNNFAIVFLRSFSVFITTIVCRNLQCF